MTNETPTALLLLDIENVPANAHALKAIGLPNLPSEIALDVYIAGSNARIADPVTTARKFREEMTLIDPDRRIFSVRCDCSPSVRNGADMLLAAQIPLALAKPYPPITVALATNDKALIEVCAALAGNRFLSLRRQPPLTAETEADVEADNAPHNNSPDGSNESEPDDSPYGDLARAIAEHAITVRGILTSMGRGDQTSFRSSDFGRRIDGLLSNSHRALLAQKFAPYVDTGGEVSVKPQLSAFGPAVSVLRALAPSWVSRQATDPMTIATGITMLLGLGRDAHVECRDFHKHQAWHVRLVRPKLTSHVSRSSNPMVKVANQIPTKGLTLATLAELMADRLRKLPSGGRARYSPDAEALEIGKAGLAQDDIQYLHGMAPGYIGSGTLPSIVGSKHYGPASSGIRAALPALDPTAATYSPRDLAVVGGSIASLWLSIGYIVGVGTHQQAESVRYQITLEQFMSPDLPNAVEKPSSKASRNF